MKQPTGNRGTKGPSGHPALSVKWVEDFPEIPLNREEAYKLRVTSKKIEIEAMTETGVYRAIQTLRQLTEERGKGIVVTGCEITDWPAFRIRGFMQDVGRTYISMDELKREIAILARYKINVFHWHLTENQSWRLQSKVFPMLNDSANTTRMPGKFYTQEEARELVDFCKQHHVLLIPEIDMPGHSAAFIRTFRHDMQSPEGMKILKLLIDEVCETFEVPYLHIGTDEVRFTNPDFVPEMVAYVRSKGKKVISWNPGWRYQPGEIDMTHLWSYRGKAQKGIPAIDSRFHYLNHFDTFADLFALYNSRIYDEPQGSDDLAGTILAIWNDRMIQPEADIVRQNNFYPNMLAIAERAWLGGGNEYFDKQGTVLPDEKSEAFKAFADFEKRLLWHKEHCFEGYPFAYVKQTNVKWRITDAFPNQGDLTASFPPEEELKSHYTYDNKTYGTQDATGAGIYLRHVWGATVPGLYKEPQENHTAYAWTWVYSPKSQEVGAWIEFQNYSRSEMDLPPLPGKWDYRESRVWVNDREIRPPVWTATHRAKSNEVLLGNENCVVRPPLPVHLQKGWNKVFMKLPVGKFSTPEIRLQKWMFTFVFVTPDGEKAVDGLIYSPDKERNDQAREPKPARYGRQPSTRANRVDEAAPVHCFALPDLIRTGKGAALGVSAPFAGISGGMLLVGGGCNFPDKPAAEGGAKEYYSDIYALDMAGRPADEWRKAGRLPLPLAYGASATTPEGLVWIGGNNQEGASKQVFVVNWDRGKRQLQLSELPPLPMPMDNLAATYADGCLYVAGGNKEPDASNALFSLQLTPSPQQEWVRLPDFPGPARVQPVLAAQPSEDGLRLYLAGGFQPASGQQEAVVCPDMLSYHPKRREWRSEGLLPLLQDGSLRTATGGCALSVGDSSILLTGGVNHNRFRDALNRPLQIEQATSTGNDARRDSLQAEARHYLLHPASWYQFNTTLLQYNTFTKRWTNLGDYEKAARAGAGIARYGNTVILINGELKPGIRTFKTYGFRLNQRDRLGRGGGD